MHSSFVIIGPGRCGSNLLLNLLRQHPGISISASEPFDTNPAARGKCLPRLEGEDGVAFVYRTIWNKPNSNRIPGFKLFYYHARSYPEASIWDFLTSESVKIIHLTRSNSLDWLISKEVAASQGKYISLKSDVGIYEPEPLALTPEWLNQADGLLRREAARVRKLIPAERRLEVTYENLQKDTHNVLDSILGFLGLESLLLEIRTRRQRQHAQYRFIDNPKFLYERVLESFPYLSCHFDSEGYVDGKIPADNDQRESLYRRWEKPAVLTIDDFPNSDSRALLDGLADRDIKSVLFCVGVHLEQNMELAVEAIRLGHLLGNHSTHHDNFAELSIEQIEADMLTTESLIDGAYRRAGKDRIIKLFRFPYGNKGAGYGLNVEDEKVQHRHAIQELLKRHQFSQMQFSIPYPQDYRESQLGRDVDSFWTMQTFDWEVENGPDRDRSFERVLNKNRDSLDAMKPTEMQIVLTHDNPGKRDVFNTLLDNLLHHGMVFHDPKGCLS